MQRTKCLHACLHIDWNPYGTFNYSQQIYCTQATINTFDFFLVFYLPPVSKAVGGIVLGSVAVSAVCAVSADVLLYISVAIKASFLKLGMCNICENNIAKMFLDFFKILKLFI